MGEPAPDLNLQLLILAGMFVVALGACLWIERRIERKEDRVLRDMDEKH